MHDRARRVDHPAILMKLHQGQRFEQAAEGGALLGAAGRRRRATVHPEPACIMEAGEDRIEVLSLPRRIGFVENAFDRRARVHDGLPWVTQPGGIMPGAVRNAKKGR
jgi:hypothetical protein